MQNFYQLKSVLSQNIYEETQTATTCPKTGEALDVEYDYDFIRSRLNFYAFRNAPLSSRKYLDLYPIRNLDLLVTLNEGGTPLQKCHQISKDIGIPKLYVKNEGVNPTGVFKDRGSLVELTKARELGAASVCCASTGNMAASVSAYAAACNMPCYVLVPEGTPIGKLSQSLIYGARVIQIRGTYADCCVLAEDMAKNHNFYLAGDYVFRSEGQKSLAYEVVEQLFWNVPDVVIVPVGCGTNLAAIWKGFVELQKLGFVDKTPRMIGVQPSNVPTIVEAFRQSKKEYIKVEKPSTVASAVGIGAPLDDIKVLNALYDSNGFAEDASESEILLAEKTLGSKEAIFVEPSGAIPIAVLPKLLEKGIISSDDTVVCVATGIGLKDPKAATQMMPDPPVLEPTNEHINTYLENKLYDIQAVSFETKDDIVWTGIPDADTVKTLIKQQLNIDLSQSNLECVLRQISLFHEKTDTMKESDLQYIVENILKEPIIENKVFEVIDYDIQMTRHKKPIASAKVLFNGETCKATSTGSGPVDAILHAAREAIQDTDTIDCKLTTYDVEINTKGTDAVVEVKMGVKDRDNNTTIVTATSPDIIVASVNAFEKGYNILARYHS